MKGVHLPPNMALSLLSRATLWSVCVDGLLRTVCPQEAGYIAAWALDLGAHNEVALTMLTARTDAPRRPPRAHELFVWFGVPAADEATVIVAASCLLDAAENAQAFAFAHKADRASYVAAHAMARTLLGGVPGCAPSEVLLERDPRGKLHVSMPRRATAMPHFSISHTRGLAAVALAACPVGIDVEALTVSADPDALAQRALAAEARAALSAVEARDKAALFLRYWTLGEALTKATGLGLAQDLQGFAFMPSGQPRLLRVDPRFGPVERWRFGIA